MTIMLDCDFLTLHAGEMNRLTNEKRVQIIQRLVEGNSIRDTARICGCVKNTVVKLLAEIGEACRWYHDKNVKNISAIQIECGAIWSFTNSKWMNVEATKTLSTHARDTWTWTALDSDSKIIVSYLIGGRDSEYASVFMEDVASRLANPVQLTKDGRTTYLEAVDGAIKAGVDYAKLNKVFGHAPRSMTSQYNSTKYRAIRKSQIKGEPTNSGITTSYVERQNLTMQMHMRRFSKTKDAFSKMIENHDYAVAMHVMYYNYCHIHDTMKMTPAMAAGISGARWQVEEIVKMADAFWVEKYPPKKAAPEAL